MKNHRIIEKINHFFNFIEILVAKQYVIHYSRVPLIKNVYMILSLFLSRSHCSL